MKQTHSRKYYSGGNSLHCTAFIVDKYFDWKEISMGDPSVQLGEAALNDLLKDAGIVKIVAAVNLASISILELLEYDVSRQDINRALAKRVISFDRSHELVPGDSGSNGIFGAAEAPGDQYFRFLSSKVKLTELGLFILETIEYRAEARTGAEPSVSTPFAGPEPNYQPSTLLRG